MYSWNRLIRAFSSVLNHGKRSNPCYQANLPMPRKSTGHIQCRTVHSSISHCTTDSSGFNGENPDLVDIMRHDTITEANSPFAGEKTSSYVEARRRGVLKHRRLLSPMQRIGGMILSDQTEENDEPDSSGQPRTSAVGEEMTLNGVVSAEQSGDRSVEEKPGRQGKAGQSGPPMIDGEYVIITRENLKRHEKLVRLVRLDANLEFKSKYGSVPHADIIGHQSGSVFITSMDIELLIRRPSLEEFVIHMKRTPVIAYPKDCCTMLMMIDVSPGDVVLEAGSGSGAMTLFLSRAVGHFGKVYSFERQETHQKIAMTNFKKWQTSWDLSHDIKWPQNVTFHLTRLQDCVKNIGGIQVDGAIIDMEEPWMVISTMASRLKAGKAMAIYVANLTQVIDVAEVIRKERLPLVMETVLEVTHKVWVVNPARRHAGNVLGELRVTGGGEPSNGETLASHSEQYVADEIPKYLTRPHHMQPAHTAFLVRIRKIGSTSPTFKV